MSSASANSVFVLFLRYVPAGHPKCGDDTGYHGQNKDPRGSTCSSLSDLRNYGRDLFLKRPVATMKTARTRPEIIEGKIILQIEIEDVTAVGKFTALAMMAS